MGVSHYWLPRQRIRFIAAKYKHFGGKRLKPRSHYKRQSDTIPFISMESWRFPAIATVGDRMGRVQRRTKFRILQLYANEERLSGATANGNEDGRAHVIVLLSAVDKHTRWKKK